MCTWYTFIQLFLLFADDEKEQDFGELVTEHASALGVNVSVEKLLQVILCNHSGWRGGGRHCVSQAKSIVRVEHDSSGVEL